MRRWMIAGVLAGVAAGAQGQVQCQAPDGNWYPYDSPMCNPVTTSKWLADDLDRLEHYLAMASSCTTAVEMGGRARLADTDECRAMSHANGRTIAALKRIEAAPDDALTARQLRVILDVTAATKRFGEAVRLAR